MKLLVEDVSVVESTVKGKDYFVEGVFSTAGEKNRNGRVYSQQLWEDNVTRYQEEIKKNSVYTLGECEHPAYVKPNKMKAVMKIQELFIKGNKVMGKAKILNNNSPETNQIKALIDEGIDIGISSRGTGRMKGEIVEAFNLSTYDLVLDPSDYNANLKGLRESVEVDVYMNEDNGEYVCKNGECMLEDNGYEKGFTKKDAQKEIKKLEGMIQKAKNQSEENALQDAIDALKIDFKISESCCSSKADSLLETLNNFSNKAAIDAAKQIDIDLETKFNEYIGESDDYPKMLRAAKKKIKGLDKEEAKKVISVNFPSYKDKLVKELFESSQAGDLLGELSDAMMACEARMKKDGYKKEAALFTQQSKKAFDTYLRYDHKENGKDY